MIRLYAPAIVLALWAALWALGATGDGIAIGGLSLTAVAVIVQTQENLRRHHHDPPAG